MQETGNSARSNKSKTIFYQITHRFIHTQMRDIKDFVSDGAIDRIALFHNGVDFIKAAAFVRKIRAFICGPQE